MQGRIFAKSEVLWYTSIREKHCLKRPATQATGTGRNHDDEMMYCGLRRIHVYLTLATLCEPSEDDAAAR